MSNCKVATLRKHNVGTRSGFGKTCLRVAEDWLQEQESEKDDSEMEPDWKPFFREMEKDGDQSASMLKTRQKRLWFDGGLCSLFAHKIQTMGHEFSSEVRNRTYLLFRDDEAYFEEKVTSAILKSKAVKLSYKVILATTQLWRGSAEGFREIVDKILSPMALEIQRHLKEIAELRGKDLKPQGAACVGKSFIALSDRAKKILHGKSIFEFFTDMDIAHILIIIRKSTVRLLLGLLPNDGNSKSGVNIVDECLGDSLNPREKEEFKLLHDKNGISTEELLLMDEIRIRVKGLRCSDYSGADGAPAPPVSEQKGRFFCRSCTCCCCRRCKKVHRQYESCPKS
ncbi:MAG: hypothetical protein ACREOZ_05380 [Gloeomargaritales cyanobacterium]